MSNEDVIKAGLWSEGMNSGALEEFLDNARTNPNPIVMANLMKMKPDGGAAEYQQYAEAATPLIDKIGGKVLYAGAVGEKLIGGIDWDVVVMAWYPSRKAFLELVNSEAYEKIKPIHDAALEPTSFFYVTNPMGA